MTETLRTTSLADRNMAGAWPDERAAVNVAIGVLIGLADIHARGEVLAGLTPALVGVRDDGAVVLNRPAAPVTLDARYASPEEVATGQATAPDDVYATGAMLYEMLAGHPPVSAASAGGSARDLVSARPGVHPQLAAVVMRSIDEQPGQRYQTADAFRADLEAVRSLLTPATVTAPVERPTDSRWPIALIVLGALLLAGLLAWFLLRGDTVTVPAVAGQPAAAAQQRLVDEGLRPIVVSEASDTVPEGTAIRTDPAAGTKVDKDSNVNLVVSGQSTGGVPAVVGQQEAAAVAEVEAAGFTALVTRAESPEAEGTVIQQSPAAGDNASPGSTVTLTVSAGSRSTTVTQTETQVQTQTQAAPAPAPTPTPTTTTTTTVTTQAQPTTVQVPTLTGLTLAEATARLQQAGLRVGTTTDGPGTQTAGTVTDQNPAAGTRVERDTDVALTLSNGQP